jgi:hypothetical protein
VKTAQARFRKGIGVAGIPWGAITPAYIEVLIAPQNIDKLYIYTMLVVNYLARLELEFSI